MQLFSRLGTLTGSPRASIKWATDVTAYVNGKVARPVGLWAVGFGQPVGTVAWTAQVDGLADLQATFAGLADDDGYEELLARGREHLAGPAIDVLREVVRGEPGDPPAVGSISSVTTATVAPGKYEEAMAWGAEMASHVESITSHRTFFLADVYGTFGQVTWITSAPDAAAADAARTAIQSDLDYLKRLGDVGDLFIPGSGRQSMATRIA
jgi:hypothetical protein